MSTLAPIPESDATQFVARPDSPCKSNGRQFSLLAARRWSGRNADRPVEPDSATFTSSDDERDFDWFAASDINVYKLCYWFKMDRFWR